MKNNVVNSPCASVGQQQELLLLADFFPSDPGWRMQPRPADPSWKGREVLRGLWHSQAGQWLF